MSNPSPTRRVARVASAFTLLVAFAIASAAPAWPGGKVMPAQAKPHGYSLTEMAGAVVPFSLSGNDPAAYPDTPFQVLHVDDIAFEEVNGGEVATATQSFTVRPGTPFYLPIINGANLEPVVGTFPTSAAEAQSYLFDAADYGGTYEITVDGSTTPIGPSYAAGPVSVDLAGEEVQVVTLGAFIHPLSPGSHTITLRGLIDGTGVAEAHGIAFIEFEFTYFVQVVPGS